jgi:hypothetical protein
MKTYEEGSEWLVNLLSWAQANDLSKSFLLSIDDIHPEDVKCDVSRHTE